MSTIEQLLTALLGHLPDAELVRLSPLANRQRSAAAGGPELTAGHVALLAVAMVAADLDDLAGRLERLGVALSAGQQRQARAAATKRGNNRQAARERVGGRGKAKTKGRRGRVRK